ncbi:MAG TPA: MGMT family protein [Kofleriaceae bacterium]|nr:MGMT family protein [Kofleriaceae bacterium]
MPRSRPGRTRGDAAPVGELYDEFYAVVRRIPRGRVLTYGQVAELAGHPGAARAAGAAMRASTGRGLPWQRVVGAHARGLAKVAILDPVGGSVQRGLLEREGVVFTPGGYIPLSRYGSLTAPPTARRRARRKDRPRGRRR